jgi:hypothetical protein
MASGVLTLAIVQLKCGSIVLTTTKEHIMTEQAEGQRTLASLQINAQPLNEGQLDVQFTGLDAAGDPLTGGVTVLTQQLSDLRNALTNIAASMEPAPAGWFGLPEQPRVGFDVTHGESSGLELLFTVANATGSPDYRPPSLSAPVSSAALTRLADDLGTILQDGEGAVTWVPGA